jgi:uncharacterized protein involved in exopolysaccharide biosynthesis
VARRETEERRSMKTALVAVMIVAVAVSWASFLQTLTYEASTQV